MKNKNLNSHRIVEALFHLPFPLLTPYIPYTFSDLCLLKPHEANVLYLLRPLPWVQLGLKSNPIHPFLVPAPGNSLSPLQTGRWWVHGPYGLALRSAVFES